MASIPTNNPNAFIPQSNPPESINKQLKETGTAKTTLGGGAYNVSIVNADSSQISKMSKAVSNFVSKIFMNQLESNAIFRSITVGVRLISITLRNAAGKLTGDTVMTVKTLDPQRGEMTHEMYVRKEDKTLSSFLLPKALKDVKYAQIQLTPLPPPIPPRPSRELINLGEVPLPPPPLPPRPSQEKIASLKSASPPAPPPKPVGSISFTTLLGGITTIAKEISKGERTNFTMLTGPVAHVLEHTKVSMADQEEVGVLKSTLENVKLVFDKKGTKTTPEEKAFIKELSSQIEKLKSIQESMTTLRVAEMNNKMVESGDDVEALLRKHQGDKENYALSFGEDTSHVNISYQAPGKDTYITTKTPLKEMMLTLRLINGEFSNPNPSSTRESFSTGLPFRRQTFSQEAPKAQEAPQHSLNYSDIRSPLAPSTTIREEEASSKRNLSSASKVSVSFTPSPGQVTAFENVKNLTKKFASFAENSADARKTITEKPGAWVFWPNEMDPKKINFASGKFKNDQNQVVIAELDISDLTPEKFRSIDNLPKLIEKLPEETRNHINIARMQTDIYTFKQIRF